MAHPMQSECVMLETFTEAQPADGAEEMVDAATVSSPDMDRLNQEADAAVRTRQLLASPFLANLLWWKT